uniref:Uncharacterized protein n=1 Tax=Arundo donax TaxID=35708 RepID=A0A0A9AV33_ARUDO
MAPGTRGYKPRPPVEHHSLLRNLPQTSRRNKIIEKFQFTNPFGDLIYWCALETS